MNQLNSRKECEMRIKTLAPTDLATIPTKLDIDLVLEAATDLGFDVGVGINGKKSMRISFFCCEGKNRWSDRQLKVSCIGKKYWISLDQHDKQTIKWSMPRTEVARDRADKFLVSVLREYADCHDLKIAVSIILGIDPLASFGY